MWNCFHHDDPDQKFGRITRRLTFEQIYASKEEAAERQNPLEKGDKLEYGASIYYHDFREVDLNRRVVEGKYIAGSGTMELTPRQMLTQLINSDHDLKTFCEDHGIHLGEKAHTWDYVLEAYDYLKKRLQEAEPVEMVPSKVMVNQAVSATTERSGQEIAVLSETEEGASDEQLVESKKRAYDMMEHVELPQDDVAGEEVVHQVDSEADAEVTLTPMKQQKIDNQLVLPCTSARRARLRATMQKKKPKSPSPAAPAKRPSRILPLEKINVSLEGTTRVPMLERIAPGVNVKDVRTWVFYFSIDGRLCRAAKEKQLRGKAVVYLNCSNKFKHRCRWKIKMEMLTPQMTPEMDEYSYLGNWSVIPNDDPQEHCHESCWVDGIKHYNSKHAQELREMRGQLLDIKNGEVRDVSPNVSLSTRAPTLTRSGRVVKKPDNPDFTDSGGDNEAVYEITEEQVITDQDHEEHEEEDEEEDVENEDSMDMSDAPGTDGPVQEDIQLIKLDSDATTTATLISDASKMVGLPMNKLPKTEQPEEE